MKKTQKTTKPNTEEIASAGRIEDISRLYAGVSNGADDRQSPLGGGVSMQEFWRKANYVRFDNQVASCLQQRFQTVISAPWQIVPGDESAIVEKAAEFVKEQLKAINFNELTRLLLWSRFYGVSIAEILWNGDGTMVDIIARNAQRFYFTVKGKPLLRTTSNPQGEILPIKKFIICRSGGTHGDKPYGEGLIDFLYWPTRIKKLGVSE